MKKEVEKGKAKQVEGKIMEDVGKATGNKSDQVKGKLGQIVGKLEETYGKARSNIKKNI
jgi:uncharacterized protein YjbJ (UPF0337 family)